jgi:hypothetical protein
MELGPYSVRVATVEHGHQRSQTDANGPVEPQVVGLPARAAGRMQGGDSNCGPEGRGSSLSVNSRRLAAQAPFHASQAVSSISSSQGSIRRSRGPIAEAAMPPSPGPSEIDQFPQKMAAGER